MSDLFEGFGKIPRLTKGWSVSEKIDGMNAQIHIYSADALWRSEITDVDRGVIARKDGFVMYAGSRKRYVTPESDNFGFAQWVTENADELFKLGPGRHFGEWFGPGIQKNPLGVAEKRLALFNPRWLDQGPDCVEVVPQLGIARDGKDLDRMFWDLQAIGSRVGGTCQWVEPEGIVAYHMGSRQLYKRTYQQDGGKYHAELDS